MKWTTLRISDAGAVIGVPTGESTDVVSLKVPTPPPISAMLLCGDPPTPEMQAQFREWTRPFIEEWVL